MLEWKDAKGYEDYFKVSTDGQVYSKRTNKLLKLLLKPVPELRAARDAFLRSYNTEKKGNCFTKVQIDNEADAALVCYFKDHEAEIESWYNVISPRGETLDKLQAELNALAQKNWTEIHR